MELRKVKCFKELNIVGFLVEKRQYWELSQLMPRGVRGTIDNLKSLKHNFLMTEKNISKKIINKTIRPLIHNHVPAYQCNGMIGPVLVYINTFPSILCN